MTIHSPRETARRAQQLLRDKRLADAIQVCRDGLARSNDDPELRLLVAHGLLAQGDQEAAKKEAQQLLRIDPRQVEAHRILADIACVRGELATASYQLEKVLSLEDEDRQAKELLEIIERASFSGDTKLRFDDASRVTSLDRFLARVESGVMMITDSMVEELPEPEPEEQATLPLLRPSTAAEPEPLLDPLAPRPVTLRGRADALGDPRAMGDGMPSAALGTMPVSPSQILAESGPRDAVDDDGGLDSFDDFDVEDASVPEVGAKVEARSRAADELDNEPTRVARPKEEAAIKRAVGPQLPIKRVSTGQTWDPMASDEHEAPPQRRRPASGGWDPLATPAPEIKGTAKGLKALGTADGWDPLAGADESKEHALPAARAALASGEGWDPMATPAPQIKGGAHGLKPLGTDDGWDPLAGDVKSGGRADPSAGAWDPLASGTGGAAAAEWDPLSGAAPGAGSDEAFERDLAADLAKVPRRGGGRWLKVIIVLLLLAGGGGYGTYWYLGYTFVKEQWQAFRVAAYRGTPSGYREAETFAKQILARRPKNMGARAAIGMCAAALAIDFGEDRRKEAQTALKETLGQESEWRTAAQSFLSRLEDPATSAGYLKKSAELYPNSALLHYLRGRALEATGRMDQEAADAYQQALKLSPSLVSARLALALLVGKQPKGYEQALADLDKVLQKDSDNVQALLTRARVRVLHQSDLASAQGDAARVSGELQKGASRGQLAWAHLVQAQIESRRIQALVQGLKGGDKDKVTVIEAASQRLNQALDAAIKSAPCCDPRFRYELAGELFDVFRLREADAQLTAAMAFKARPPQLLLRAARCELALGNVPEAQKDLDAAPPNDPEARLLRGWLLYSKGAFKGARAQLSPLFDDPQFGVEAQLYAALAQARARQLKEALASLRALVGKYPHVDTIQHALGTVYRLSGDMANAESAFKQAWRLNRLDPRHATALGEISLARYDFARAERRLRTALETRPDHTPARIALSLLALGRGDPAKAMAELQKVLPADQQGAAYLLASARVALARGDLAGCESGLAAAQQAGARPGMVAHLQGDLALAQRKAATALPLLEKARKLLGKSVPVLLSLGRAQLAGRRTDAAYDSFQDALDVDKGNPEALIELGTIAIRDGELPRSLVQLGKAIAEAKRRKSPARLLARAYALLGKAHLKRGDTGRALANLQDALDVDGEAVEPHVLMGQTYKRLNRPERALAYYQKALALLEKQPGAADPKQINAAIEQLKR